MKRFSLLLASGLILLLVAAGCGGDATSTPITQSLPTATTEPTAVPVATDSSAAVAAVVETSREGNLGVHLVDGDGMTLYLYTRDERNVSNCTSGCADAWPPLTASGDPSAGEEVAASILGSITRADGSIQPTYNGWPLYRFSGDQSPGDANGQDSRGVWFTVSTNGGPIQSNAAVNASEHPDLGTILVEASGRTLYQFSNDEPMVSTCSGGCARAWPPLVTVDDPAAGEDVDGDLLGTISRENGSVQVTYGGRPLYYFAGDEKPGDTNGNGVGGVWSTVSSEGVPSTSDTEAGGATSSEDY